MKTWTHVERRLERMHLPYRVQDETLVSLDGTPVAVTVQGARDFLSSPGHPDSKRQQRRRHRDLTRHGARKLKVSGVITCTLKQPSEQQTIKRISAQLRKDELFAARILAGRLRGRVWNPAQKDYIARRLGGFYHAG